MLTVTFFIVMLNVIMLSIVMLDVCRAALSPLKSDPLRKAPPLLANIKQGCKRHASDEDSSLFVKHRRKWFYNYLVLILKRFSSTK
jgi:hypothetical protein